MIDGVLAMRWLHVLLLVATAGVLIATAFQYHVNARKAAKEKDAPKPPVNTAEAWARVADAADRARAGNLGNGAVFADIAVCLDDLRRNQERQP